MANYYKVLGISKTASQEDVDKAYRNMARKYHPDLNPDDPEGAKKKFQELQEAYDTLKDPEKRKLYDQFGSGYKQYGGGPGAGAGPFGSGSSYTWSSSGGDPGIDINEILGQMFGGRGANPFGSGAGPFSGRGTGGNHRTRSAMPGQNVTSTIRVPFKIAAFGGTVPLTYQMPSGRRETLDVKIPAGIDTGKKIRLRGKGEESPMGGVAGDLILEVQVEPHKYYTREGKNIYVHIPITLKEAALGGKVDVPTPTGTVTVTIPAGSTTGTKLRIKEHGITSVKKGEKKGDLFVVFDVALPAKWSKEDLKLIEQLAPQSEPPERGSIQF
ncbi:MAG: J domain-containing protein [Thermoguttaceae bacterium]|nr:J domain-containing protein [Thermoguttaceae bacterium]